MPQLVTLAPPPAQEEIVAMLDKALDRARRGEFEMVFFVGVRPDGSWVTVERGARGDKLRVLGILESVKSDVLAAAVSDEVSGL